MSTGVLSRGRPSWRQREDLPKREQRFHISRLVALVPDEQIFAVVDLAVLALEVWV